MTHHTESSAQTQEELAQVEELAALVCTDSQDEAEQVACSETLLQEKYGIDMDTYHQIVKDLLPFTPIIQTAIDGQKFHAFVNFNDQSTIVRCPPSLAAQELIQ